MGAFQAGFRMGQDAYQFARESKRRDEEDKRKKEQHELNQQLLGLQLAQGQRTNRLNAEIDEETAGLRSYLRGDPPVTGSMPIDSSVLPPDAPSAPPQQPRQMGDEDQAGLNRRVMGLAALKGDYNTVTSLNDRNRELNEQRVFNEAVRTFSVNPDSFTEYTRWVNKTSPMISAAPAKDPRTGQVTGYNIMTVTPSGDAAYKFLTPQQAATLAGATALMRVNPVKALQLIGSVDTALAGAIQASNTATKDTITTSNTATHSANQDATSRMNAESNRMQAGAAARNADANSKRTNQTEAQKLQEKVDAYSGILMRQNPKLTKAEADKQAAGILLRDPNAKETDVGLAEAGIFRVKNKYFRMGRDGEPEEVRFDGGNATLDALRALQESGQDPFAQKPKKGREASGRLE